MRRLCSWILGFWCVMAAVAAACELPDIRTSDRPGQDIGPVEVSASFIVLDVLGVDDANQQIELDMRGTFRWRDSRLAGLDGCRFNVTQVWFPNVDLLNSSNLRAARTNARNEVAVGPDGNLTWIQRFTGQISSYHNLRNFPFDSHSFEINIASLEYGTSDLVMTADEERSLLSSRLNIEGWDVEGIALSTDVASIPDLELETSVLTLAINASRSAEFYVYRIMLLLVFVVGMSWTIFWVPPNRFEFQIGLGATSMLTAIAFNLSLSSSLPTLGYLTILDKVMIWAIVLIFLSIVEALIAGLLVLNERQDDALKIDRISRIAFPTALFLGWVLIIVTSPI